MTRIIAVAAQKGGVAKTTCTVNLAAGLARAGKRTLLLDMDPQANASYVSVGTPHTDPSLYHVLVEGNLPLSAIITPSNTGGYDLAPANIFLSAADIMLSAKMGRERVLARKLAEITPKYDYVIIDTPPSLGVLTVNAIVAADEVIIPVAMATFALIGLSLLEDTIEQARANLGAQSRISGVIGTFYDRTTISRETLVSLKEHFGDRVFPTLIPRTVKLEEANNRQQTIFDYAPGSNAATAFENLTKEVIERA